MTEQHDLILDMFGPAGLLFTLKVPWFVMCASLAMLLLWLMRKSP